MKIRYIQPSDNENGFEEVIVTREEAIKFQKNHAKQIKPEFIYQSDEDALNDYIAIHWADVINE